jgi:8-oxo-dGTP pyrophosphatase MutT (NUDIX family)
MTSAFSQTFDPQQRVATVFLLREDGAALLQLRDELPGLPRAGMWVTPGGHCDPGESIEDCAHREFLEETQYDCLDLGYLGMVIDENDVTKTNYPLYVFWSRYDGRSYRCCEGQELRFLRKSDVPLDLIPPCLLGQWDRAIAAASGREF